MKFFKSDRNKIFIGANDKLPEWLGGEEDKQGEVVNRVRLMLKNYLELDNVSFLFGSGSSLHLGAVSIRNFPLEVEAFVKSKDPDSKGILNTLYFVVKQLQAKDLAYGKANFITGTQTFVKYETWKFRVENEIVRDDVSGEMAIEYEKVLNFLIAMDFVFEEDKSKSRDDNYGELIVAIKEGLFEVCDVETRDVPTHIIDGKKASEFEKQKAQGVLLETKSKYTFHEKFVKALLQRPLNLRRANIFTANYDLAFEYAFDKLGVHYIDGFAGFHKRFFKPETFEYDIFYPGSTTSGKVQRIEKVVRYFKLHGSLSWVNSESRDSNNLFGIEEKPLELIDKLEKKGEIIIYPSAVKKSYTLDLPYSELFRQFASTITQSQSVLVTVGYSFGDDHFNDIIYQALSNPTFTLIIVDFAGTKNEAIEKMKDLNDPRIIILEGDFFGDFLSFADTLMPNFNSGDNYDNIASTLNGLFNPNPVPNPDSTPPASTSSATNETPAP